MAGILHVHTTLSDGGGTPEEVIAAARWAGLGFIVITDHNNLDAKRIEGYHEGVLVLVGTEISTTAGHLLGLGIPDPLFRFSGDPRDVLDDVRDLGGFAVAAHPLSPREDFQWTGWDLPGPWGLELMNGDSQWRAAGWGRLAQTGLLYALNPRYALVRSLTPPSSTLARWDSLLANRAVSGLVGADAHNRLPLTKRIAPPFPSYESVFALAQNHVLLEQPLSGRAEADAAAVLGALSRGRSYTAVDALAPANEFSFTAEAGDRRWTMGDTAPPEPGLRLRAGGRMPQGARIHLLKDGTPIAETVRPLDVASPGVGVYRVEVRVPGWDVPWILTNPIYVFSAAQTEERERNAAWPAEPPVPETVRILDAFDTPGSFAPEFDPSSYINRGVIVAGAGPAGAAAARLEFRLGVPGPGRPYTWCALVSRQARDLSGSTGLVFSIRSDRPYRIWVQVRDENPASTDDGTEWWFASVRASPAWRRVAVPFARLRTLNKMSDGQLDLDKVRQLVFVLDQGAVKPGTQGVIWIDGLGVY